MIWPQVPEIQRRQLIILLGQMAVRVLNGEWEATFRQWYPGFRAHTTPVVA